MKATEIIQHFEKTENDVTEVSTSALFLNSLGWEFGEDYENWKEGNYSGEPYTQKELSSYESYLEATTVYILVYNDGSTAWGSLHNSTDRTPEGYDSTGDNQQTLLDISENLDKFFRA